MNLFNEYNAKIHEICTEIAIGNEELEGIRRFREYDVDGSGSIEGSELGEALAQMGIQSNDSEFLPNSKKQWNSYRYNHKLRQLGKVFSNLAHYKNNNNMPDIIGLCEVENRLVIEDLLKTPAFSNQDYTIVHQDGPDSRGIDCALLFSNKFKLLKYDFISIKNANEKRPTRDIVYVKLAFKDEIINLPIYNSP